MFQLKLQTRKIRTFSWPAYFFWKPYGLEITKQKLFFFPSSNPDRLWATVIDNGSNGPSVFSRIVKGMKSDFPPSVWPETTSTLRAYHCFIKSVTCNLDLSLLFSTLVVGVYEGDVCSTHIGRGDFNTHCLVYSFPDPTVNLKLRYIRQHCEMTFLSPRETDTQTERDFVCSKEFVCFTIIRTKQF